MLEFALEPMPHDEAAKLIADKPAVTKDVFNALPDELKARAFTITGIEDFDVLAAVRDRIAELPAGADWNKVKKDVITEISPWFNSVAAEKRAELLMRHHAFTAYAAAQAREMDELIDVFPYRQYISTEDSRVRPSHAALHGIILPADHKFWATHTPPWEWNCRCDVVELTGEDMEEERRRDGTRAADSQRVLTGPALSMLENENRLVRGVGTNVDLRTPKQKGGNFEINVRDLNMNYEEIQKRWDDKTREDFETWADDVELSDGKSLADYLIIGGIRGKQKKLKRGNVDTLFKELEKKDEWSRSDMANLKAQLKVSNPKQAGDIVKLTGWKKRGVLTEKEALNTVQELLDILPLDIARTLPDLQLTLAAGVTDARGHIKKNVNGQYSNGQIIIASGQDNLRGLKGAARRQELRRVLSHELMHWLHLGSTGRKATQYRKRIAAHYAARTKDINGIPDGVGGVLRQDHFWDIYAGREYAHENGKAKGVEIPTRYYEMLERDSEFEWHSSKDKNKYSKEFRETMKLVYNIFK